ncbi:hypothetical protein QVN76_04055, partial [Yersinia rochesterensis]|uniref:hypothetical protein n=1 Tax=Yersinia rochesterensis TaxID=1604335 RepID=UPI0025AA598A
HRDLLVCRLAATPMTLSNTLVVAWHHSVVGCSRAPESLTGVNSSGFTRLPPCCNTNDFE